MNQILTRRRGSAPVGAGNGESTGFLTAGKGQEVTIPRRGSVPSDFSKQKRRGSDGSRPGSRRRRRRSMKRRSSGGPDVLLSTGQSMDSFLAHRRGSLPVEILATSFSGPH
ncbi:PREDICTED: uncharacterized protein LOC107172289 isoform X2 [Diuraphis noxia]|uniref:uncharacterized protein LOC107172289 isoform X2 n=1 Tax=Diuraphis noxia TaxID=143948 RepID=UPI0007639216|nr:PREDICTED: uncharacterized protein LOC107172289 isoform X2 [Diuraphis noxia]